MENQDKAKVNLSMSFRRGAAFQFGFWGMLGAMGAFGLGLMAVRVVRWAEAVLRTWWGF
jgi:hypothetical protein